jgi:thioredoxin 1
VEKNYPDKPIELTDSNFDENVKKYSLIVIDNWAPWCPPCRMLAPVIESLAKKYANKIVFGKLNVDENKKVALKYGIMSIPTLLVFKNGKLVDRIVGAMPESVLESRLKPFL